MTYDEVFTRIKTLCNDAVRNRDEYDYMFAADDMEGYGIILGKSALAKQILSLLESEPYETS